MEMVFNTVRMIDHDQLKEYVFGDFKSLNNKLAIVLSIKIILF